jgi:hypothetical protein
VRFYPFGVATPDREAEQPKMQEVPQAFLDHPLRRMIDAGSGQGNADKVHSDTTSNTTMKRTLP